MGCDKNAASQLYDVSIVHSGSDMDRRLEYFIRHKLDVLQLSCGPINYDNNEGDSAIFNDNLKTLKHCKKAFLIFYPNSRKMRRCRFERLFALHLHVRFKVPMIIPVVMDLSTIPDKYSVFQEVVVHKSSNWCSKLLRAIMYESGKVAPVDIDQRFANVGREEVELKVEHEKMIEEEDDFAEFGTAFDTICFQFLDEFLSEKSGKLCTVNNELDEILRLQSALCERLESSSLETRIEFVKRNSKSGLFPYIGQMGLNNIHKLLMEGCGMTVTNDIISLKWKTFEQNLLCSTVTLADIVNFSKFVGIKRISLKFDEETHNNIEKHYGENWQELLVMFAERILNHRFSDSSNELLTYHVNINGIAGHATQKIMNRTGRSIHVQKFDKHFSEFQNLQDRLKTYHNWPSHKKTKPLDLAKAGFVYSGHEDTITCFSCNQSIFMLDHLGEASTPSSILMSHCIWNKNCVFLKSLPNYRMIRNFADNRRLAETEDGLHDGILFEDLSTRLRSFDSTLPQLRCLEFARAGFFQRINEKFNLCIACFSCFAQINFVKLSKDPWIEHVRWSPQCQYLLKKKGKMFVESMQRVISNEDDDNVFTEVVIETYVIKKSSHESEFTVNQTLLEIPESIYIDDIELD